MNIFRGIYNFFYEIFFGCSHKRQTRPFTLEAKTYKVCLDCGVQVFYSPATMRPMSGREVRRMRSLRASEVKVINAATRGPVLVQSSDRKSSAA
jgi:hypothetical protein